MKTVCAAPTRDARSRCTRRIRRSVSTSSPDACRTAASVSVSMPAATWLSTSASSATRDSTCSRARSSRRGTSTVQSTARTSRRVASIRSVNDAAIATDTRSACAAVRPAASNRRSRSCRWSTTENAASASSTSRSSPLR
ncbi:hypothetical protein J2S43_003668 [Catenuloplanes nepalensis]|uniref:Uncharacterized protein n=1 Tax=Catenuloplanes nepalensis TaxID=587533 RepID=A0ABT9MVX3_9ACTN|nr:hypothetical protein [Catenuloplanes nepalensis]MDP9795156.1 hypothetical protein [Catenuloplanes nepalensis]